MKSSWTEFCLKVKEYTSKRGQNAADKYLEFIDPLFSTYKSYNLETIIEVFQDYVTVRRVLEPQIRDLEFQLAVKEIIDMCEALLARRHITMEQVNEFIHKAHTIVIDTLNDYYNRETIEMTVVTVKQSSKK